MLLRSLAFSQKEENIISIVYRSKGLTIFMKQFFFVSVYGWNFISYVEAKRENKLAHTPLENVEFLIFK